MSRAAQDESFVSSRSVGSRSQSTSTKPKSGKVEPYISPFVAKATKRAEERVKQALRTQQRSRPKVAYEWDESISTPGLFDPKIRKQEIFRLKPKRSVTKQGTRDDGDNSRDIVDTSLFDSSFSSSTNKNRRASTKNRVTMRTQDVSPHRAPPSAHILSKSVFQGGTYPTVRTSNDSNNSGSTRNHNSQHSKASHAPHRPPVNSQVAQHYGKGVTRSTSPIDESVVVDILTAEPQHEHDKHYKLHHRNSIDHPDHSSREQEQQHSFSGTAGKMDRAAAKELYGNMIRERLRAILVQRRGGEGRQGNDFGGGVSMDNNVSSRRGFYGPSRVQQEQELAARDLMASMATIMTAVGEIVAMKNHKKKWYKQSLRRSRSARDGISPEREYCPSNSNMQSNVESRKIAPNKTHYSVNGGAMSAASSQGAAEGGNVSFALTRPDLSPNPYSHPVAANGEGKKSTANFMFDLARTIEPVPYAHETLPENKAAAFDMIMSKLQSIEQCEREIQVFLQHPRRQADDEEDDRPVDPVLRDLQQSMARNEEKERQFFCKATRSHDADILTTADATEGTTVTGSESVPPAKTGTKSDPANEGYAFLKQYPSLAQISSEIRPGLEDYKKQLDKARQLREVAFTRKNSTSAITGDTVANAIFDKLMAAVANEIDRFTEDYSKHFATQL